MSRRITFERCLEGTEPETCPDCHGDRVLGLFDGDSLAVTRRCLTCDGTGVVCPECGNVLQVTFTYDPSRNGDGPIAMRAECVACTWEATCADVR